MFSSGAEKLGDYSYSVDDVIVLEIEAKGSAEPFQVLLEPYALIIPGESYIGITVKKDFKVRNPYTDFTGPGDAVLRYKVVRVELTRPQHGAQSCPWDPKPVVVHTPGPGLSDFYQYF